MENSKMTKNSGILYITLIGPLCDSCPFKAKKPIFISTSYLINQRYDIYIVRYGYPSLFEKRFQR